MNFFLVVLIGQLIKHRSASCSNMKSGSLSSLLVSVSLSK